MSTTVYRPLLDFVQNLILSQILQTKPSVNVRSDAPALGAHLSDSNGSISDVYFSVYSAIWGI
jgi:hypothetical protein